MDPLDATVYEACGFSPQYEFRGLIVVCGLVLARDTSPWICLERSGGPVGLLSARDAVLVWRRGSHSSEDA